MHLRWIILVVCLAGCRSAPPATARPAAAGAPAPWSILGQSHQGRPIEAATFGRGPLRAYLIGGIHGDETEGLAAIDTLRTTLVHGATPQIATVRLVRDANPDGTAAHTRGNARRLDLNRNWPARNFSTRTARARAPLSEPETAALHRDLLAFDPHLVIVFHSSGSGPFVNFDGPASEVAHAFAAAARTADPRWRIVPDMGYRTPGSLGSYIGVDRGIPILTIEFRRGQEAKSVIAGASAGVTAALRRAALAN